MRTDWSGPGDDEANREPSAASPSPPRHGDVHDSAEEEERDELGKAALHGGGPSRLTSTPNDVSVVRTMTVRGCRMGHLLRQPDTTVGVGAHISQMPLGCSPGVARDAPPWETGDGRSWKEGFHV